MSVLHPSTVRRFLAAVVTFALLIGAPVGAAGQSEAAQGEASSSSLYERLGGVYPIATVVDHFIDLLLVNPTLNANPAIDASRDRVPKAGLKFHVTTLVCQVTGGPCEYVGRSMEESHAHLNISQKEWQAMLDDFRRTLDHFGAPGQEQEELIAIVESTKGDIVTRD